MQDRHCECGSRELVVVAAKDLVDAGEACFDLLPVFIQPGFEHDDLFEVVQYEDDRKKGDQYFYIHKCSFRVPDGTRVAEATFGTD